MLHSRSRPRQQLTLETLPFDIWHYFIEHLAVEQHGREGLKALRLVIHDPELQEAMLKAICETVRSHCTRYTKAERQDQLLPPERVAVLDTYVRRLDIRGEPDLESTKLRSMSVQMTRLARQSTTQRISLRDVSVDYAVGIMRERASVAGNWELHLGCSEEGASRNSGNGQSWIELYAREQHYKLSKKRWEDWLEAVLLLPKHHPRRIVSQGAPLCTPRPRVDEELLNKCRALGIEIDTPERNSTTMIYDNLSQVAASNP